MELITRRLRLRSGIVRSFQCAISDTEIFKMKGVFNKKNVISIKCIDELFRSYSCVFL